MRDMCPCPWCVTDAFWLVSSASTDSWVRSLCWQIVGSVLYVPGDMGDQEITFADVDWSEDSHMEECDPGAPLTEQASSGRNPDYTHEDFAHKLKVQILPNDQENCGEFDVATDFRIGDPNVHFRAAAAMSYETIEEVGKPDWNLLFGYILTRMSHLRFFSTVYVLVDNRDLTNLDNPDPSLQHWPAVAAWWSSRARMQGPAGELCDVVFFPVGQASGLHMVHHTWAGTFVLAALCLVFPGLHIVLLDSDCVPVTLFEVEDLWREAQRLQHSGFPGPVPTSAVGLGDWTRTRWIRRLCLTVNHKGWSWSLNTMQKSMRGLQSCGAPIMLLRFGRKTGSAYHSTLANPMSQFFANTEKSWLQLIGRWSLQWFQMDEMTETWHLQNAKLGSKRGWL